jgi:hypothetical protein
MLCLVRNCVERVNEATGEWKANVVVSNQKVNDRTPARTDAFNMLARGSDISFREWKEQGSYYKSINHKQKGLQWERSQS